MGAGCNKRNGTVLNTANRNLIELRLLLSMYAIQGPVVGYRLRHPGTVSVSNGFSTLRQMAWTFIGRRRHETPKRYRAIPVEFDDIDGCGESPYNGGRMFISTRL